MVVKRILLVFFFASLVAAQLQLDNEEVETLKEIAEALGQTNWNFSMDPCRGQGNWSYLESPLVTCDCSSSSSCKIVSMNLKWQNLSGMVPPGFSKLHYLRYLDLGRNSLTGSVPPEWTTMSLLNLSLMGNRLSGPFPAALTTITSLIYLSVEGNLLTGSIPPEIGRLINLKNLILSSNVFTGELPHALANLTKITDMRISDNNFSGKIPDFFGTWTQMEILHIQGSSLEGPIPSNISFLTLLNDLRISDLNGRGSSFPPLQNMIRLETLILRKCSISGVIPDYLVNMTKIGTLDLSYNNLTGEFPKASDKLSGIEYLYLTGNKLTGAIPGWILPSRKNIDLSNNKFTWEGMPNTCPQGNINLVESFETAPLFLPSGFLNPCLVQSNPCEDHELDHYSLHVNCGGSEMYTEHDGTYEADLEPMGASAYYMGKNWALSSTGNFIDDDVDAYDNICTNTSALRDERSDETMGLYETARTSALSLTYYGLCMINGNYTVRLHFAEIIYGDDNDPRKRIFDVYMQEKLVLKDFNIKEEAGGSGIALVKNFTVVITSNTLKIHLYWAGKGTTGFIPVSGSYGPLISAISVDPNFTPPSAHGETLGIIIGIVSGAILLILMTLWILRKEGVLGCRTSADTELRELRHLTDLYSLHRIKVATRNFDESNKIGAGGFGSVYKGTLPDGTLVAVKQLSSISTQGNREFVTEVGSVSGLQHPNLVKLHGCCVDGKERLLIYEYMENNSVDKVLFGQPSVSNIKLDWATRRNICLGVARGLAYLHEESGLRMFHRDIKPSNILLDQDLNAKISDFGLARLYEEGSTHISTRPAGTPGYMAPEYGMFGRLTDKADVYSFGVVVLEIITRKRNSEIIEDFDFLCDWAFRALRERDILPEVVDPELGSEYVAEEVIVLLNVARLCTKLSATQRPTMSQVVGMIEGSLSMDDVQDLSEASSSSAPFGGDISRLIAHIQSGSTSSDVCSSGGTLLPPIHEEDEGVISQKANTF